MAAIGAEPPRSCVDRGRHPLPQREANKYNTHTDRHVIGLPRILDGDLLAGAPFAVYQTDQEGETLLFATGLHRARLELRGPGLKIRDKLVLLDTFAIPSLLATPL
jgi:3-phenylpropionate/cinnamic acid dioxygenase small subunit